MDVSYLLADLNAAQREAVCAEAGHYLVLAGAGAGKTRVLVHRIGWLIAAHGIPPSRILAVTFTNKAAAEMRHRVAALSKTDNGNAIDLTAGLWIGTFHGIAHKLLRLHWRDAGLSEGFQILDADDQVRMLKRIIQGMELDEARFLPRQAAWFINAQKDEGRRPAHLQPRDPIQRELVRIYQAYQEACERSGLVDFAELLLRAHELLRAQSGLLQHYQQRFGDILVDEFQDTNAIQYAFIRLLAGERGRCFVVGDDDQAIYGWRGARVENVRHFLRDYPATRTLRLEQNYRSTATILAAANAVIRHNGNRLGKELWTSAEHGEAIELYRAYNEVDEARFVVERIRAHVDGGGSPDDCAILYRSNAQSRLFEEALLQQGLPYRIHGGLRFFDRAEIKDSLAYLRLIANRHDDPAFERCVNTPPRGIGDRTLAQLRDNSRQQGTSLWSAANQLTVDSAISSRVRQALGNFLALIDQLATQVHATALASQVETVLDRSGLRQLYQKQDEHRSVESRSDNLDELVNVAGRFAGIDRDDEVGGLDPLSLFLSYAALEAGEHQAAAGENCVQLMSLHAAKGLEFASVFLTGLEEGLFPSHRSIDEPDRLDEERRLAYVGITRAQRKLIISFAEVRRLHGSEHYNAPSRFLREIPDELIEDVRPKPAARSMSAASLSMPPVAEADLRGFRIGDRVRHPNFGPGRLANVEGSGAHTRVQVDFEQGGSKWLVLSYAPLQRA